MNPDEWRAKLKASRDAVSGEIHNLQKKIDRINQRKLVLDREIYSIKEQQKILRTERDRMNGRLSEGRTFKQRSGMLDPWSVEVKEIAPYIISWCDGYNYENDGGAFLTLSMMSEVSTRTISLIYHQKRESVTLGTADMLLTAIGAQHIVGQLKSQQKVFATVRGRPASNLPKPPPRIYEEE